MKLTIYTFHTDTDEGNETHLFASRAEHVAAILAEIERTDAETAARMRKLDSESDEWGELFHEWKEIQCLRTNYYASGEHEIELPLLGELAAALREIVAAIDNDEALKSDEHGDGPALTAARAVIAKATA